MANEKNIKDSITVLKRVRDRSGKFDLHEWQEDASPSSYLEKEEHLYACGTAACIGGWIATSPEFHAAGGGVRAGGVPVFNNLVGVEALTEYWGISFEEVELLCNTDQDTLEYYGVNSIDDITIDTAIDAVESLLK